MSTTVSHSPSVASEIDTITLVDFYGNPYSEAERLEHNQRVAAGADYAPLLTVDDMNARFRLVSPRKVFDAQKNHTWTLGEIHAMFAASMTKQGRKNVPVTQLWYRTAVRGLLTWERIVAMEPALSELVEQAQAHRGPACPVRLWYRQPDGLRAAMSRLVGWKRQGGPCELQGDQAYDIAYRKIYGSLPDCAEDCQCSNL